MGSVFLPAQALMDRIAHRFKFVITGGVTAGLILVLLVAIFGQFNETITTAQSELDGVPIRPLARALLVLQQHRGLSSGVLNGNQALFERRAVKEKEDSRAGASRFIAWLSVSSSAGMAGGAGAMGKNS